MSKATDKRNDDDIAELYDFFGELCDDIREIYNELARHDELLVGLRDSVENHWTPRETVQGLESLDADNAALRLRVSALEHLEVQTRTATPFPQPRTYTVPCTIA